MATRSLFDRLQQRGEGPLLLLRAPEGFDPGAEGLASGVEVSTTLRGRRPVPLALVFVRSCAEIAELAPKVVRRLTEDARLWFAYPKKSSKRLRSDIGRDDAWEALGALGFEGVRQVAVDEDWTALRFRRAEAIGTLRRDPARAVSAAGQARATELGEVFDRLRALVLEHAQGLPVRRDERGAFAVDSHGVGPNGKPLEFVSIATRARTVNVYVMPIYVDPELGADLPERLSKRRQGKSCFNFPRVDEALFGDLSALLSRSRAKWEEEGRITAE